MEIFNQLELEQIQLNLHLSSPSKPQLTLLYFMYDLKYKKRDIITKYLMKLK